MKGNPHARVVSNQATTRLWSVLPRFSVELSQTERDGESFLSFDWTSCTCQDLDNRDNLQNTLLRTDQWPIENKLSPEVSNRDPSVGRSLVRKQCRACTVSRRTWELTEANVLVWPCPAPLVLYTLECFPSVQTAMSCLDDQRTPSAAQRKTVVLSVLDLHPLSIFYSLRCFVCVFMSTLTYSWCIGTSRQHPV